MNDEGAVGFARVLSTDNDDDRLFIVHFGILIFVGDLEQGDIYSGQTCPQTVKAQKFKS